MSHFSLSAEDLDHVLTHTRDLWEDLRGQRLFLTGGTGFFGMWLVESFLWANERLSLDAQAVVLSRDSAAFFRKAPHLENQSALTLHLGDVRTFVPPPGHFSHILHAATPSGTPSQNATALSLLDTIVQGTRQVLDFAVQCGAQNLLLTSSGAIYGRQPPELPRVSEDYPGAPDPMDPKSAYGLGKRLAEHLCALYADRHGLACKIARCFAFVGPYLPLDVHFAIGNFIRDGLAGNSIQVQGDGSAYRSYLYAADLTSWLWTILLRGRSCVPYNVGSEVAVNIGELAGIVAANFRPHPDVCIHGRRIPGKPAERYIPLTNRGQRELGVRPWIELRKAIERTVTWHVARLRHRSDDSPV
ncbi:MAG: NAD(P)-dependent oxidoreductase [Planctomycetota bacterium]|nr:NAD(P)-dependent oxidoreductase [Planctomycetota bacterium]